MDCSLPGPSVCGISQARILEWVAISFSREGFSDSCGQCIPQEQGLSPPSLFLPSVLHEGLSEQWPPILDTPGLPEPHLAISFDQLGAVSPGRVS